VKLKNALLGSFLVLGLGLGNTSCLGSDHAYGQVKNWNVGLSDQDWVNELVFLGLHLIPVYPLALLGDVVIFNTIHYWSGDNPISDPGQFKGFTSKD
jgi:hypothetical protein